MAQIQGKVEAFGTKETKVGTMYSIKVDTEWYGTGKTNLEEKCSKGSLVTVEVTENGQFKNIKRLVSVGKGTSASPTTAPSSGSSYRPSAFDDPIKNASITYQTCIKGACQAAQNVLKGTVTTDAAYVRKLVDELFSAHDQMMDKKRSGTAPPAQQETKKATKKEPDPPQDSDSDDAFEDKDIPF